MANTLQEQGSRENPIKFKNQDYQSLKSECLKSKKLFEDPEFPTVQESIGLPVDSDPSKAVVWLRPKEINKQAQFIENTAETTDICQGQLGNCWFLAAMSCLTLQPPLFSYVVPDDQSLQNQYAGIFRFRFWQYGKWMEVVIDDRLPTAQKKLLFTRSKSRTEFWSALLEKAYSKLNGCYASLKAGSVSEALEDFTGGIGETVLVSSKSPEELWGAVNRSLSRGTLLSCFIQAANVGEVGVETPEGLVKGHAYSITGTTTVHNNSDCTSLLRVRNPWGFVEYKGPWSDNSDNWKSISKEEKERLKLQLTEDGEFWMCMKDFCQYFTTVEMCSVNPDSLGDSDSAWGITSNEGSWVPGCSAGGSPNSKDSFWQNPQFMLKLLEEDDEVGDNELSCSAVVELLQKFRRQRDKVDFLYIAFHVYEVKGACGTLGKSFFTSQMPMVKSGDYSRLRAVRKRIRLPPGQYVIVPSTFKPNQEGSFFMRIYAKKGNKLSKQDDGSCSSNYIMTLMAAPVATETKATLEKLFEKHAGLDNRLNAVEFMKVANSFLPENFSLSLDTCRGLLFGEDTRSRGTLNLQQAGRLVTSLATLQKVFVKYDQDSSGTMNSFELRLALAEAGFHLNARVMELLWLRHGTDDLCVTFDGFTNCVAKLRKLFDLYESEAKLTKAVKERGINAWLAKFIGI
ncbi:calpain-12 [Polypterus senegalus]|uniref:calpain-12 n=1 Tax=Polypterus senegalus TaxID=55291 RepID=UPI00196491A6|nr:calpain-12 [Polypterus senegalus]